jgi:hypothetical protein
VKSSKAHGRHRTEVAKAAPAAKHGHKTQEAKAAPVKAKVHAKHRHAEA